MTRRLKVDLPQLAFMVDLMKGVAKGVNYTLRARREESTRPR